MADTWITDLRHFLDESGELPEDLPGPALKLALFQGSIVSWMTAGTGVEAQPSWREGGFGRLVLGTDGPEETSSFGQSG